MKKNDLLLISSVALYSYLFYDQTAGINFLLFSIVMTAFLLLRDFTLLFNRAWIVAALGSMVTSVAILLYGNTLSVLANVLSLSLAASFSFNKNSSLILALLYSLYSYLSSIAFIVINLVDKKVEQSKASNPISTKVALVILPVMITGLFFVMYREANPVFKNFTQNIHLDFITWPWVRFTLMGFILLYGFFNHQQIAFFFTKDLYASDNLNKEKIPAESTILGKPVSKENENLSGIILFALLNLLLLVVNFLDVNFLWVSGALPEGMTYSDFVHQGVGLLIVSILIAIAIILFYFRGGLNFYEKNSTLKVLAYLWILQNAVLILTTASKNELYVSEYSLTYKRIGVFIYLLLSLIGLATTFIKIIGLKSNWFLFRKNAWAFYGVFVTACFINWDSFIATFNIQHSRQLDKQYLLSLSSTTLPGLIDLSPEKDTTSELEKLQFLNRLHYSTYFFMDYKKSAGWQSWNLEDSKVYHAILKLEKEGKLNKFDLTGHSISYLEPISGFKNLEALDLTSNSFVKLEQLANFPKLRILNMHGNKIERLDSFPKLSNLKELDLSSNDVNDLSSLSKIVSLETLRFRSNEHTYANTFPDLPNLVYLDVSQTPCNIMELKKYQKLKELRVSSIGRQHMQGIPFLSNLELLDLSHNTLSPSDTTIWNDLSALNTLTSLNISYNQISTLIQVAFEGNRIEDLNIERNALNNLWGIEKFNQLKILTMGYCGISNVAPLKECVHLTELDLTGNFVTNLSPLAALTGLKKLDLTANRVNDIRPLIYLRNLEELQLDGNSITDITSIEALQQLRVLNLSGNTIIDYAPLATLKKLESLELKYISDEVIKVLSPIKTLRILRCDSLSETQQKELKKALPQLEIQTGYVTPDTTDVYPASQEDVQF